MNILNFGAGCKFGCDSAETTSFRLGVMELGLSSVGIGGAFCEAFGWEASGLAALEGTFFLLGTQPPPFPIENNNITQ